MTLAPAHVLPVPVRRATPTDLDALVTLELRAFSGDRMSRAQYRRHLASAAATVLVAGAPGEALLGSALVFFRKGSSLARLYSIAVAHGARGRGVGEALLAAVEDAALHRGARRMRLEVRHDNAAAMRLYERRGYARFAERPGYYEDGGHAWRYEKKLGLRAEG